MAAGAPEQLAKIYLDEMFVHKCLGVRVLMIQPEDVAKIVGDGRSFIAGYGDALALRFVGGLATLDEGSLSVLFGKADIKECSVAW